MDSNDQNKLLQDTIDFNAPPGTGDSAVLHQAQIWFLREHLGSVKLPVAPNMDEQRKMLPILEGFAKAMILCAAGDGDLADEERAYILGFCANCGATHELLEELRNLDHRDLNPQQLLAMTERPGLFTHALIYYAIKAADGDGVLDDREVAVITMMSHVLGVGAETVQELVVLHREEQAFHRKKMAALFPNGHPWA
ncbi:MAG: hypothetical protein KC636_08700 [Myxococcales bacterium]|nr:hypothetical protein [Myxococcales bacterium]